MRFFRQSFLLSLSFLFVFVWQNTPLSQYTAFVIAGLIVLFFLLSVIQKGKGINNIFESNGSWSIAILTTIVLLAIFMSGVLNSYLFFLLYFLCFGIAIVFEPMTVFVFLILTVLIFLQSVTSDDVIGNWFKLGSVAFITPLAYFFGKSYGKEQKQEVKMESAEAADKHAADKIAQDVEAILKRDKKHLKEADIAELNDILQNTQKIREKAKE